LLNEEQNVLKGYDFVYFAPEKWDSLWRNRQQLMSIFSRHNKVLFVERRLHLRPTLTGWRRNEWGLADLRRSSIEQISENLYVFRYPLWAPVWGRFDHVTRLIRQFMVRNALRELGMSQPIVWFSNPYMLDVMDEIPSPRLRIYHVVDEYTTYNGRTPADRHHLGTLERQMMSLVDMVVVVSPKLYETKQPFNPYTYLIPNGVNYQAYSAALADPRLPARLQAIKCPRLGYIGLISDKLNLDILKEVAEKNPDWSLVLVGEARIAQQRETWQALQELPNVHYFEPVNIAEVPHYVKGFQVGLMPYLQNQHADHISPLKLYDYLAAGVPVASLDIPAAREFGQFVHLADGPRNFGSAVHAALADTAPERSQARRNVTAQHTWESRVEQLSEVIQAQLVKRSLEKEKSI
jgi:glycosyltransferase involved in cell wall biosynthesis